MNMCEKVFGIALIVLGLQLLSGCTKNDQFEAPLINEDLNDLDSPINRGFVYTCNKTGSFEVWKQEGGEHLQITESSTYDAWWPRYCSATDRILYYRSSAGRDINDYEHAELWVMDGDGSNKSLLIKAKDNDWDKQGLADWSPDGSKIVMAAVDSSIGTWQLYLTDANGTNLERVSTRDDVHYLDPVFSPDGESIYFITCPEGSENTDKNFEVYHLELSMGVEERLTFNDYADHHPHPSPDGKHIAYESLIDPNYLAIGKWVIHTLELESSTETILIDDDNINLFPRYAVEGDRVLYSTLSIEHFGMKIASFDLNTGERIMLVDDYYNALNVDPF